MINVEIAVDNGKLIFDKSEFTRNINDNLKISYFDNEKSLEIYFTDGKLRNVKVFENGKNVLTRSNKTIINDRDTFLLTKKAIDDYYSLMINETRHWKECSKIMITDKGNNIIIGNFIVNSDNSFFIPHYVKSNNFSFSKIHFQKSIIIRKMNKVTPPKCSIISCEEFMNKNDFLRYFKYKIKESFCCNYGILNDATDHSILFGRVVYLHLNIGKSLQPISEKYNYSYGINFKKIEDLLKKCNDNNVYDDIVFLNSLKGNQLKENSNNYIFKYLYESSLIDISSKLNIKLI